MPLDLYNSTNIKESFSAGYSKWSQTNFRHFCYICGSHSGTDDHSSFVGYCSMWIGLLNFYSVPCDVKFVNDTNGSAGHRAQAAKHPTSMTESVLYLIGEMNATVLTKDQQYSISQTAVSW